MAVSKVKQAAQKATTKLREYNNLALLTAAALLVTVALLAVSIFLYRVNGTAQLDLSRPGYESARDKSETVKSDEFAPTGTIDSKTVENFKSMFNARAEKIKNANAFGVDSLNDESFGIAE